MKVQKSHLRIAVFILAVAVLYNLWYFFGPNARPAGPPMQPQPILPQQTAAGPAATDPASIPAPAAIDVSRGPTWTRDPFLFGNESRESVRRTALQNPSSYPVVRSILFSSSRRLAIVDGRIMGVGDTIGAYTVADIQPGSVVFTIAGGERRRVDVYGPGRTGLTR
ncbi:MAG: hypothetical protein NTY02_17470 [Acidobacteria bacterium]|nr:hypothetical protein [Acidobacteriota bacterium]